MCNYFFQYIFIPYQGYASKSGTQNPPPIKVKRFLARKPEENEWVDTKKLSAKLILFIIYIKL